MYRILLADDEQIVLDSVKYIIDDYFENVELKTVDSGRKAILMASEFKPDIILMDIRMPGIDGIEAIKEIKFSRNETIFIIISAHNEFDFAREAVELGVVNYLLKPVSKDKIIKTINKIIDKIEDERERKKNILELREKYEYVLPVIEHGFIYSVLLFNENNEQELISYKDILEINEQAGFIMVIEYSGQDRDCNSTDLVGLSLAGQSLENNFREIIKGSCKCIVGPLMLNRFIVFVPINTDKCQDYKVKDSKKLAETLYNKLSNRISNKQNLTIGIGNCHNNLQQIYHSYEEAITALKGNEGNNIVHIQELSIAALKTDNKLSDLKDGILENIASGKSLETLDLFNYLFAQLREHSHSLEDLKHSLLEIMVMVQNLAYKHCIYQQDKKDDKNYIKELLMLTDENKIKKWCFNRLDYTATHFNDMRQNKMSDLIKNAQQYIGEHYYLGVTLDDVAREINVSPNYFSKLFKEETGENFIKYLTSVRIDEAKKLLQQNKYSIKKVSSLIGYSDPNYFSRLFKKEVGVSPTEYQGQLQ